MDLAIHDALIRQRWKPPYRELQDFLDACDTMAKRSVRKITAAIPAEHLSAIIVRVESTMVFLQKFDAELQREVNRSKTDAPADRKKS
jgi:acyl carrier protein phosphodiesterase